MICLFLVLALLFGGAVGEEGFDAWLEAFNAYAAELQLNEVTADEFEDASEYLDEGSLMVIYDDASSVGVAPDGKGGIGEFFVDGDPASDVTAKLVACTLCAADGSLDLNGTLSEAQRIVKETNMNGFAMGRLGNWMYLCYRDEDEIGAYVDVMFTRLDGEGKGALPPAGKETPAPEENPSAEETPAPAPFHTPAPTDKPVHKA